MLSVFLLVIAVFCTATTLIYKNEWDFPKFVEVILSYILFFNLGLMALLAAYFHVFLGAETARNIGWEPGSPFQFEMGMANLAFGVLGVMAFWQRGNFWDATIIGWNILFLGCFVGHVMDFYVRDNTAPWNFGFFIWFNDLILPLLALACLIYLRQTRKPV